jgi:hypothetical protein
LAVFDGRLYMAWKGINDSQGIWFNSFDGKNWSPQHRVTGVGTGVGPSLAVFHSRLYMAWRGAGLDNDIYWTDRQSGDWIPQHKVGGARTSGRPSLAVSRDRLYLAWRGVGGCCAELGGARTDNSISWASSP